MSTTEPAPLSDVRTILTPGAVVTRRDWPQDTPVRSIHVICIGGAGMSAVARLALEAGFAVSGSDSQDGQFIAPLREAGARIGIGFDASLLSEDVDVVVVSTAVRPDNPEVIEAHRRGLPVVHRAAALAGMLAGRRLIAVAGTHGKTSTTGMCAMALRGAGEDPAWAVGAAVPDLGRNAGFGAGDGGLAVVEADESDGSFLAFHPHALVVTNLEPDHLDFHGDAARLTAAFDAVSTQIAPGGILVACADDPGAAALAQRAAQRGTRVVTYGTDPSADWRLLEETPGTHGAAARVHGPTGELMLELSVAGHHNVLNAIAALAATTHACPDADLQALARGLGDFHGASRRWDVAGTAGGVTVVDDYAHHPREVTATLQAARAITNQAGTGRVLAVFQPHLFSRTRDFAADFASSLALADEAWVLPVYGAREDPDPSIDARTITAHAPAGSRVHALQESDVLEEHLLGAVRSGDLLLMLGAGDIVNRTPSVLAALEAAAGTERG